jgi:hypothetical protein
MAEFAQQLLTTHPHEAAKAFEPLVTLCTGLLDQAAAEGTVRADLPRDWMAGVLLQAVMVNAFASTISGTSEDAGEDTPELFWRLVSGGIGSPGATR